jgi:hypothetical protein
VSLRALALMIGRSLHSRLGSLLGLKLLIVLVAAGPAAALADVPEAQAAEVEHLLDFIRTTTCELIRNGRAYSGDRAYRHVMRKYDYFRDRITSTEQFIELSATRSTLSGQPYWFACGDSKPVESETVLLEELARFRDGGR